MSSGLIYLLIMLSQTDSLVVGKQLALNLKVVLLSRLKGPSLLMFPDEEPAWIAVTAVLDVSPLSQVSCFSGQWSQTPSPTSWTADGGCSSCSTLEIALQLHLVQQFSWWSLLASAALSSA